MQTDVAPCARLLAFQGHALRAPPIAWRLLPQCHGSTSTFTTYQHGMLIVRVLWVLAPRPQPGLLDLPASPIFHENLCHDR